MRACGASAICHSNPEKSDQEVERESAKDNVDVADVWKHQYGDEHQLTGLFIALARAAGVESDLVATSTRNRFLFNEEMRNPSQLDAALALVQIDGQELFLAPGVPCTPFGALPWYETAVKGMRLGKSGNTWVMTPLPPASASQLERKASLRLMPDSSIEGTVTYTFTGLDALTHRFEERNEDAAERQQRLEGDLKDELTGGGEVTLKNTPDWSDDEVPLVAVFDVKMPGWARSAGTKALIPSSILTAANRQVFDHATRIHPVYFQYPNRIHDDVTIELPPTWNVGAVPAAGNLDIKVAESQWTAGALHLTRDFTIETLFVKVKY